MDFFYTNQNREVDGTVTTTIVNWELNHCADEINMREGLITPRMRDEALLGSTTTGLGDDGSLTALQYITAVRADIQAIYDYAQDLPAQDVSQPVLNGKTVSTPGILQKIAASITNIFWGKSE